MLTYWINGEDHPRREKVVHPDPEITPRLRHSNYSNARISISPSLESLNSVNYHTISGCRTHEFRLQPNGTLTNGVAPAFYTACNSVKLTRKARPLNSATFLSPAAAAKVPPTTMTNGVASGVPQRLQEIKRNGELRLTVPGCTASAKPRFNSSLLSEMHHGGLNGLAGLHGSTGRLPDRLHEHNSYHTRANKDENSVCPEGTPLLVVGSYNDRTASCLNDVHFQV